MTELTDFTSLEFTAFAQGVTAGNRVTTESAEAKNFTLNLPYFFELFTFNPLFTSVIYPPCAKTFLQSIFTDLWIY